MIESTRPETPRDAWQAILDGNRRFVSGTPAHPRQDIDRRESLAARQKPFAALFGCSDSRLSAEIIFDVGLGDLFVVLGHDECGAIRATIDSTEGKLESKGEFIHDLVERIRPTVEAANRDGKHHIDDITQLHIQDTINELLTRSKLIADAVKAGKLAVVGANYTLSRGEIATIFTSDNLN